MLKRKERYNAHTEQVQQKNMHADIGTRTVVTAAWFTTTPAMPATKTSDGSNKSKTKTTRRRMTMPKWQSATAITGMNQLQRQRIPTAAKRSKYSEIIRNQRHVHTQGHNKHKHKNIHSKQNFRGCNSVTRVEKIEPFKTISFHMCDCNGSCELEEPCLFAFFLSPNNFENLFALVWLRNRCPSSSGTHVLDRLLMARLEAMPSSWVENYRETCSQYFAFPHCASWTGPAIVMLWWLRVAMKAWSGFAFLILDHVIGCCCGIYIFWCFCDVDWWCCWLLFWVVVFVMHFSGLYLCYV